MSEMCTTPQGLRYHFPEVIDSTILATFSSCSQKFFHEHILCLAGSDVSEHLHAGGAFARGIEVARKAYWFDRVTPQEAVLEGFKAFIVQWGEIDFELRSNFSKDFVNTAGAYFDYFRQYPLDIDPIQPYILPGDRPAVEFTFGVPLPIKHPITGNPLLAGGRMDMIGYYQNFLCIVDEKTTGALGSGWESKWKMRGQFLMYPWAAREHNIPARTILVRGTAIQKTQYAHLQAIVQVEEWRLDEWWETMISKVEEMVNRFEAWRYKVNNVPRYEMKNGPALHYEGQPWRKDFADACDAYGGCIFRDLCTSRDPTIWYDTYKHRLWNPLALVPAEPLT